MVTWIFIDSIVLRRLETHEPLAPARRPLIAIEIAPPAVALMMYFALALFLAANALIGFIALRTVTALAQGSFLPR